MTDSFLSFFPFLSLFMEGRERGLYYILKKIFYKKCGEKWLSFCHSSVEKDTFSYDFCSLRPFLSLPSLSHLLDCLSPSLLQ